MSGASVVETSPVVPSSTATNPWPTTTLQHLNEPSSSQTTPNTLSAAYDPFAPFHPAVSAAYSHDIYSAQTAEPTALPASPALSGNTSQRSSFSSTPASEVFTQAGSIHSYTPRIKMEDHPDYVNASESMIMNSPQISHLVTSTSPYPGSLDATFYQDQHSPMGWPKIEYSGPQDLPSISSLPIPPYDRRSESRERSGSGSQGARRGPSTIARTRQPRKLTTKEDANFQCHVKGCGKLFGRSYNFKAHMETHDTSREYPFPCPLKDCNKKFVRKTDLQRHHQSVHMKQRNHRCDYCSRYFARKDTLRRHMEDGCSKRFDIETVDFRPQSYSNGDQGSARITSRAAELPSRQASYSSSHYFSPPGSSTSLGPHDSSLTSSSGSYLERHEYMGNGDSPEAVWSN
ncbi:Transcription factor [Lachnellula occidentalis]|uniref:Transcription factor n=1 Tax=Lachnellula occidentalis TaxID=215460 RepID=A0A8H8S600_9HELO|nr:Transcription factor [Lachnellula occidentalis]